MCDFLNCSNIFKDLPWTVRNSINIWYALFWRASREAKNNCMPNEVLSIRCFDLWLHSCSTGSRISPATTVCIPGVSWTRRLNCVSAIDGLLQVSAFLPESIVSALHLCSPSLPSPIVHKVDRDRNLFRSGGIQFGPMTPLFRGRWVILVGMCWRD